MLCLKVIIITIKLIDVVVVLGGSFGGGFP